MRKSWGDDDFERLPSLVYHYTNAAGFLGIARGRTIWATDYRFLNDSEEILYGKRLLEDAISERSRLANDSQDKFRKALYDFAHTYCGKFVRMFDVYIACFCEDGDALTQWRGYGEKGGGFSLGFERLTLMKSGPSFTSCNWHLRPVVYELVQQHAIINAGLDAIEAYFIDVWKSKDYDSTSSFEVNLYGAIESVLGKLFFTCMAGFKNPDFRSEKEWRIIYFCAPRSAPNVQFRESDNRIIPYVPLLLHSESEMPLKRIILGPTQTRAEVLESTEYALKTFRYDGVEIERSGIPFR
jgi:hypothetical protein